MYQCMGYENNIAIIYDRPGCEKCRVADCAYALLPNWKGNHSVAIFIAYYYYWWANDSDGLTTQVNPG